MRNSIIKKLAVVSSVICLCFSMTAGCHLVSYAALPDNDIAEPQYIAIKSCDSGLSKSSGGLKCEGATNTSSSYTAGVQVQLQQYMDT